MPWNGTPPGAGWTGHTDAVLALLQPALAVAVASGPAVAAVAGRLADVVAAGGRVFTFGAGHSKAFADELCYRAGGLRCFTSMNLDDLRSTPRPAHEQLSDSAPERDPANGPALLSLYRVGGGDALIIASQSGRNGASVEMADAARSRGTYVAAVVSRRHSDAVVSRHPSGHKLVDVVDDVIDNHGPVGDAAVTVSTGQVMGATSTVSFALVAQLISVALAETLIARGAPVDVITSANVDTTT